MMLCEFLPRGDRLVCAGCDQRSFPISTLQPIRRECGPRAKIDPAPVLVYNDLAATGPCRNRGETIAIETCQLCGSRGKQVESFLCLVDRGAAGPPSLASMEQWTVWQNPIPRNRSVCSWCDRYQPASGTILIAIEG